MWNRRFLDKLEMTISLLGAGLLVLAGCQKEPFEEPEEKPAEQEEWILTLEASKGADTKALNLETDGRITASWTTGDKVAVFLNGGAAESLGNLTATVNPSLNTNATLAGSLTSVTGVTNGSTLTLLYPRATWDYTGQDGSAPSASGTLATKYDYALANVTVSAVDGGEKTITTDDAIFANQQSIYRFKFSSSGTPLSVKQFTVSSSANKLVQSRSYDGSAWTSNFGSVSVVSDAATSDWLYMSLRNELDGIVIDYDTYTFVVKGGDAATYTGTKDIPFTAVSAAGHAITVADVAVSKVSLLSKTGAIALKGDIW